MANRPPKMAKRFVSRTSKLKAAVEKSRSQPYTRTAGDPPHAGYGHTGGNNLDKGIRDGSCNRTACQRPLKGRTQYVMTTPYTAGEKLYYCADCADLFAYWDRIDRPNEPPRCALVMEEEDASA